MNNKLTYLILAVVLLCATVSAAEVTVSTGVNYDWWRDSKSNHGSQGYIPLRVEGQTGNITLSLLTAQMFTDSKTASGDKYSLSNALDTKVNASYLISGKLPVDILLGLDMNLPTGKTDLSMADLNLVLDSELVTVTTLGEGFNINPTISIAKEWGRLVAGISGGYLWRGKYDYSSAVNMAGFQPGAVVNTNAELRYYHSKQLYSNLVAGLAWYGQDEVAGRKASREGDFSRIGAGLHFKQQQLDGHIMVSGIFRGRGKIESAGGDIVREPARGHGNEFRGDLLLKRAMDDKTALNAMITALLISDNGYSAGETRHIGRREKLTAGLGAVRKMNRMLEGGLLVKGFVMHDSGAEYPAYRSSGNYRGFSVMLQLTGIF